MLLIPNGVTCSIAQSQTPNSPDQSARVLRDRDGGLYQRSACRQSGMNGPHRDFLAAGGLGLLIGMLPGSARHKYDVRHAARLRLAGMFWHFVGIAWVVMFLAMYVA